MELNYKDNHKSIKEYLSSLKIDELKALAESGNADAQYALGESYSKGHVVILDNKAALHYYKLSAANGHIESMVKAAMLMTTGKGIKRNKKEARQLLKQAKIGGYLGAYELLEKHLKPFYRRRWFLMLIMMLLYMAAFLYSIIHLARTLGDLGI